MRSTRPRAAAVAPASPPAEAVKRCPWATKPLDIGYHDTEWGVPLHDDTRLFELLILEGAQAGLSWSTILAKRENYRAAFDGFDAEKIARYRSARVERLLRNEGIVRNRLKIEATIVNARAFLALRETYGAFDRYIWQFVDGKPVHNRWNSASRVPASSPLSDLIAKDLSRSGFKFVGSTIVYAFLQAAGLVNDHLTSCFRYTQLAGSEGPATQ
jgi:DNA-3-methyladenine glycosylase I